MQRPNPALTILSTVCLAASASAQGVVSPNDRTVFEGSSSSSYPLGRHDARLQQIHADVAGSSGLTISEHAYRRDAIVERGDVPAFTAELAVVLSIAAVMPDAASRDFASNAGASPVTVLNRTRLSFPTTSRPASDPAPVFEHRIPYGVPFQLPAGAPLCVDVEMFGNVTSRGPNQNFSAYLDAHALSTDGSVQQPGFVFDVGCPAPGATAVHDALFSFDLLRDGSLSLDIRSRNGVATRAGADAYTALVVGLGPQPFSWPSRPECRLIPSIDATYTLPGPNDAAGGWSGAVVGARAIPPGQRFLVQLASVSPASGDLSFSDTSIVTVPAPGPSTLPAVRIASGSDRTSATGTVSSTVTVTQFR